MSRIHHKKAKTDREQRACIRGVELRSADGKPGTLVGYGAVFNSWSDDLGGFREMIRPGAFDKTLSESLDIKSRFDHDYRTLLGRTSSKTLRLSVDDVGLRYEVDIPDTSDGRDVAELVRRGDVVGSSFEFMSVKDEFRTEGDEVRREIHEMKLFEVGPVIDPAYPAATVSVRSLPGPDEIADPEILRRLYLAQGLTDDEVRGVLMEQGLEHGPARTTPISTLRRRLALEDLEGAA